MVILPSFSTEFYEQSLTASEQIQSMASAVIACILKWPGVRFSLEPLGIRYLRFDPVTYLVVSVGTIAV